MKINLIWVGTTGKKEIKSLCDDYIKRIGYYSRLKIKEVKEESATNKYSTEHIKEREAKKITEVLEKNNYNVALHPEGKSLSSEEFSSFIERKMTSGCKGISFVVAGELGHSREFLKKSDFVLSLSEMTYTHDLARLILCEQLYRAFTIIKGTNYHK